MKPFFLSAKARVLYVTFTLFGATLLLDYFCFQKLFFLFPNEMEWDSSPWYNFAYSRENSIQNSSANKVLIAGSSVALYSVLPHNLRFAKDLSVNPQFYSHVALAPTDLFYYKGNISAVRPKLLIYFLNFADLQWEYIDVKNGEFIFNEKRWTSEFADRYPAKTFYPWEFLADYFNHLTKKQITKLAAKSLLYVSRYRSFLFDPLETFIDNHFRNGRSYQKYAGSIPAESIWSKGWTLPTATMACEFGNRIDDSVFLLKENTEIRISFYSSNDKIQLPKHLISSHIIKFEKSGWNTVEWEKIKPNSLTEAVVRLEILSSKSTAKEADLLRYGLDFPIGIRLSHYFCKKPNFEDRSYVRESFFDESRYSNMTSAEFDKDYFLRQLENADLRPELGRLNTLRTKKKEVKDLNFKPWFEYNQILRVSDYFKKQEIPFMIILSPENPIESISYSKGIWFNEMIHHLETALNKNGHTLVNHLDKIPNKQYFFDPHHMTYDGASSYQPFIENLINDHFTGKK